MRILVLSQYFWPETFVIHYVVEELVKQGHEVTVATGKPNYPDGKVFPGYKAAGLMREQYSDKVDVVRVPLWPRGAGGGKNLILNYLSFVVSGCIFFPWMLRGKSFDHVFVFAPSPVTQIIPGILIKWIKRASLSLWVQDLWPESLVSTGYVKNKIALSVIRSAVKWMYSCCDRLLVQSKGFYAGLQGFGMNDKIRYLPNPTFDMRGGGRKPDGRLAEALAEGFSVVFAGNLGSAQSLDTIIDAATRLSNEGDIKIFLFGSGSRESEIKAEIARRKLGNVILAGRYPLEEMPGIYQRSSTLLVTLKDEPAFALTIPGKLQAYMAAGRPIIACLPGEGARLVSEAGAGIASPADNGEALADTIIKMKQLAPEERNSMAENARAYYLQNFTVEAVSALLVEQLSEIGMSGDK